MADLFSFEVECPRCKTKFSIEEVISDKVRSEFESRMKLQVDEEIKHFKERQLEQMRLEHQMELKKLKQQFELQRQSELKKMQDAMSNLTGLVESYKREIERKDSELANARKVELELRQKERELLEKEQNLDLEVQRRLSQEIEQFKTIIDNYKKEIESKELELANARQIEMEFRRKENELLQKEQNLELEVQRRLSQERQQLQELIKQALHTEYELKLREKEEKISSLHKQIEELNLKLQVGSQQLQGEVQELALEEQLRTKFPFDTIKEVPKGVRGADIIQEVRNKFGEVCGIILWESKRTNSWSNEWIPKLKEDQREIGAEISVIVSRAMPREISSVGLLDGVWVCNFNSFLGLAMALRENLIQVNTVRNQLQGRESKMEQIYNYICSEQFSQKVRAIVEAFVSMKNDLDKERAAMEKHWKKREEELTKVIKNTVRIYGELEAIAGNQLPEIDFFKLPGNL
ncbi:MAG: DUF2130 domain-containing protein [Candidatus Kapaibacteriota bacterium]